MPAIPLFLVCVVLVEAVSWLLSYLVVPLVFAQGSEVDVYALVVTAALLILGCALVFLVVRGSLSRTAAAPADEPPHEGAAPRAAAPAFETRSALQDAYGLTSREAQLAVEYADGYSLKKVAEHLGIKQSTAQGYIRKAYRKLGITSKDQLVDLIRETRPQ